MPQCSESLSTPELDYEGWKEALRPHRGRYNRVVIEPKTLPAEALSHLASIGALAVLDRTPNQLTLLKPAPAKR
jgi:hypothetical protein